MGDRKAILALIMDMDGVLWRGNDPIGDLPLIFSAIEQRGWKASLATNNATLSITQYVEKLRQYDVHLKPEQIVNSAQATAHYLLRRYPGGGNVYVVGEQGLVDTLKEQGFNAVPLTPASIKDNPDEIVAVVAAMDRQVTYEKLTVATRLIRAGVLFLGTNPDRTFPTPDGLVPGAGAILASIQTATDVQPIITGKPSPEMYHVALERMQVKPQNCLVIGDRLETDIAGGQQIGCQTALVLSGVSSLQEAQNWQPAPDWISTDLTRLLEELA
jgi:phosphoglycolate/pyridoxal phosphate phosphatase family enzyme